MESENHILKKIREQLEIVRGEFSAAEIALNTLVKTFIDDVAANLKSYMNENIKRGIRKMPDAAEALTDEKFASLRRELDGALEPEVTRIVRELTGSGAWLEDDVAFLDLNSKVWKTVKSVEPVTNEILKKYGLTHVNMKNWAWLSPEIDALITMRFPAAKKEFTDRRKQLNYLENRYLEETRLENVLNKLESL